MHRCFKYLFKSSCIDLIKPSCIDLIVTDEPNLVLDSGVRPSLDPTVKHQITYCKLNFQSQPLPNYKRHIWNYNRANTTLLNRSISNFDWTNELNKFSDPSEQVDFFNNTLLNIFSNFIPNEIKTIRPKDPPWFKRHNQRFR